MYYFKYYLYRWFILFSVMVLVTPSFLSLTPLYIDYWRSHPCWKKQILWCLWKIPHTGYSTHREYDTLSWGIVRVDRPWINRNWLGRHFLDMIVICMSCLENAERQSHWNKQKNPALLLLPSFVKFYHGLIRKRDDIFGVLALAWNTGHLEFISSSINNNHSLTLGKLFSGYVPSFPLLLCVCYAPLETLYYRRDVQCLTQEEKNRIMKCLWNAQFLACLT